ncbi:MAG: hypothetical protein FWE80_03595 [Oscillospiraceae bacterium]|nr:hypothetical protein [Oscillospiraceae bacterium]
MEDMAQKIESFLSDPDSMQKISAALASFGAAPAGAAEPAGPESNGEEAPAAEGLFGGLDMGMILKLLPLLQGGGKDDKNTALLKALRPFFNGEREKRLDEALQMIRLMNFLPAITNS